MSCTGICHPAGIARQGAREPADREGDARSQGGRRLDRGLYRGDRTQAGRNGGGPGLARPGLPGAPAGRWHAAPSPSSASGLRPSHVKVVENTPAMHNLVVCTLCSCYPWPVLGMPPELVQVGGLSRARGARAARRARRVRRDAAGGRRGPGLGQHRRAALHGSARAARRHRGLERGCAGAPRHPQRHDRHRARRSGRRVREP